MYVSRKFCGVWSRNSRFEFLMKPLLLCRAASWPRAMDPFIWTLFLMVAAFPADEPSHSRRESQVSALCSVRKISQKARAPAWLTPKFYNKLVNILNERLRAGGNRGIKTDEDEWGTETVLMSLRLARKLFTRNMKLQTKKKHPDDILGEKSRDWLRRDIV